ncbi:NUDIX domain-containing protein [Actinocatenispora sera]|uniref:NUDIX domain-containing protein n=1 Tax=Actinocatenispora sera TaxID=390989 RepID=UPI0033F814B3
MARERFRMVVAVYGLLRDGDRLLLMRRAGSGYHDGELCVPAGHVDGNEDVASALARELREELTIAVEPDACRLALVAHRAPETAGDHEYLDLFFEVPHWDGTPAIGEPAKCVELCWADADAPPADTVAYVAAALREVAAGTPLLRYGWPPD